MNRELKPGESALLSIRGGEEPGASVTVSVAKEGSSSAGVDLVKKLPQVQISIPRPADEAAHLAVRLLSRIPSALSFGLQFDLGFKLIAEEGKSYRVTARGDKTWKAIGRSSLGVTQNQPFTLLFLAIDTETTELPHIMVKPQT